MKKILIFLITLLFITTPIYARHKPNRLCHNHCKIADQVKQNSADTKQNEVNLLNNAGWINDNAALINENSKRINDLEKSVKIIAHEVYANGGLIGKAIIIWPTMNTRLTSVSLIFNEQFTPSILKANGRFKHYEKTARTFYYTEPECQGKPAYVSAFNANNNDFIFSPKQGTVYDINSTVYYSPPFASLHRVTQSFASYRVEHNSEICHNYSIKPMPDEILIKLLPNNPNITGIKQYPFPTPITFQPPIARGEINPIR